MLMNKITEKLLFRPFNFNLGVGYMMSTSKPLFYETIWLYLVFRWKKERCQSAYHEQCDQFSADAIPLKISCVLLLFFRLRNCFNGMSCWDFKGINFLVATGLEALMPFCTKVCEDSQR